MSIEAVMAKYENHLMGLPNVTGVAIGERAGKRVIRVFVTRKIAASALRPEETIPKKLQGIETDVEESDVITAQGR